MVVAAFLYLISVLIKPQPVTKLLAQIFKKNEQVDFYKVSFIFLLLMLPCYLVVLPLLPIYLGSTLILVTRTLSAHINCTNKLLYKNKELNRHTLGRLSKLALVSSYTKTPILGYDVLHLVRLDIANYSALVVYMYILQKQNKKAKTQLFLSYGKACLCILITGYPL